MRQYTDVEKLQILLACEREEIGESTACEMLGMYRVEFRGWANQQFQFAEGLVAEYRRPLGGKEAEA